MRDVVDRRTLGYLVEITDAYRENRRWCGPWATRDEAKAIICNSLHQKYPDATWTVSRYDTFYIQEIGFRRYEIAKEDRQVVLR